ncbi:uncharacterized protein TNCV_3166501 [Trichonephila clavipes]|uniref:Tc1-like transposase DDE domain-containing protein n=1 Tax=Trichonephila clavipes TaxID=2585209 RepID=A0A8X6REN0_TRICX|nr:uncharacterized protein TNCV_3166501 [Trichonephila clavipes]
MSAGMLFYEGKQTTKRYLDILDPAMLHFYPNGDGYFTDDNATIHHARSIQNWFSEHHSDFLHLPWQLNNLDHNTIENMGGLVKKDASVSILLFYLIYKI